MNQNEKAIFIQELASSIVADMMEDLRKTPENWDGHELRQWLIDRTTRGAGGFGMGVMDRRRLRDYRNEMIVRNL